MDNTNKEHGMSYYEHIKDYACTKEKEGNLIITDPKGDLNLLKQSGCEICTHDVGEYQVCNSFGK